MHSGILLEVSHVGAFLAGCRKSLLEGCLAPSRKVRVLRLFDWTRSRWDVCQAHQKHPGVKSVLF